MRKDKLIFKWAPLIEPSTPRKPRVRVAQFGDGYEQRQKDGINNDLRTHSLKWAGRDSLINEIESFLEDRAGVESFYYIHKKGEKRLYKCSEWTRVDIDYQSAEISATFKEVVN